MRKVAPGYSISQKQPRYNRRRLLRKGGSKKMNVMMFMYTHKHAIVKEVAKQLGVKRCSKFKVKEVTAGELEGLGVVYGYYEVKTNTIYINRNVWNVLAEHERFELIIHELIHMYQHMYCLCAFEYQTAQDKRPQEIHAEKYTKLVLDSLVKQNMVSIKDSVMEALLG